MASLTDDDLDGVSEGQKYPDGTVVRVFCMRTDRDAYPSGWAYKLHYGATEPDPDVIEFPGMVELWERFWSEIPKSEFEVE